MTLRDLSTGLIADISRWTAEIKEWGPSARGTLLNGVMHRSISVIEAILRGCIDALLPLAGEEGRAAARSVACDRPMDRLTMGRRILLLKRLAPLLGRKLPEVTPALDSGTMKLLDILVEKRNDFIHHEGEFGGRWQATGETKVLAFLRIAGDLSRSRLVEASIAIQESEHPA